MFIDQLRRNCGDVRKCKNITELARRLGVARSTIYRWSKFPGQMPFGMAMEIIDILDLSKPEAESIFLPILFRKWT